MENRFVIAIASEGASAASGNVSPTQGDDETHKLLEERISILETETEKLKAENEELQTTSTLKEERAKTVLKTARAKIQKSEDEKKKIELELEQIGESRSCKENLNVCLHYLCLLQARQPLLAVLRRRTSN